MSLIPATLTRTAARSILLAKKGSPRVMFIAGIVGVTASAVLACKATLKLDETLDEVKYKINDVKGLEDDSDSEVVTKDLAYVYCNSTLKIARLYAPSVALGVISIGALTGSHITLTRRNASLAAAYAGISEAFKAYKERVQDELGDERELEIRHNIEYVEDESNSKKKPKKLQVVHSNGKSPYARYFCEGNVNWQAGTGYNQLFLKAQQNYANDMLQARGHVFLNDVYDTIGFDRSTEGAVVGWLRDSDGDNYIDFGIFELNQSNEHNIILDFNVDGVIYDLI